MHANVYINVWKDGKIIDHRRGHNVWVESGRAFLAQAVTYDSPVLSTTEGTVDLVASFPTLTDETLILRVGHTTGHVETLVTLSSPVDSTALLSQINAQVAGFTASLGGSNGLVLTTDNPTTVEIVAGTAMPKLGLIPEFVAPAGYTTTPLETRRIKYMGFGIGGVGQSSVVSAVPPVSTAYPPGADPNATTGNEYRKEHPLDPLITTLERPVRVTGGVAPYPGDPADVWLVQDPKFVNYIITPGVMSFHGFVDGAAGDMLYGPFIEMPLSEVGLFLSDADIHSDYNPGKLVAYFSFGTIMLTLGVKLELVWTVSF
jgi:hypothetical protein